MMPESLRPAGFENAHRCPRCATLCVCAESPCEHCGDSVPDGFHFTEPRRCVECERCGFAFDAVHGDDATGYSCPCCAEYALRAALAARPAQ